MAISRLIFSLKMKLRSGFRYGDSSDAVQLYRVIDDDSSDDSEDGSIDGSSGNNRFVPELSSVCHIQGNRVVQIFTPISSFFQSHLTLVKIFIGRFGCFVVDCFKMVYQISPTILGIVGGVISLSQYWKPMHKPMQFFVEVDGELFVMNKVNKTN